MKHQIGTSPAKGIILIIIALFFSAITFSQKISITGEVIDIETGDVLPGAIIVVKNSDIGTSSDSNGAFKLEVESDSVILVVSFIGFENFETGIKDKTDLYIELSPLKSENDYSIDEVIIVGYGTIKKSDLTGSVSSVKGDELGKITSSSLEQSLQGKVTGLQISNISGAPGSIPILRLRGVGTLNNSSPIYVVDGMILDDISFINSADIESIEVLKDASATAIYGSRGANGVILITSKSGKSLKKTVFSLTSEYSMQYLQKKIDLLSGNDFANVVNEIYPGTFNNLDRVPNTDWQDEIFKKYAPISNVQFSFSGATDKKYNYYFGMGYFDQDGIIPKSGYNRLTSKLNQTYYLTDFIRVGSVISLSSENQENTADVISQAYRAWPSSIPKDDNGSFLEVRGAGNPLASIEYNNSNEKKNRAVGDVFGEINFLKYFLLKSSYGFDINYKKIKSFTPVYYVSPTQQNVTSDLTVTNEENKTWLWENTLNFNYDIDQHFLNILGGYTMQKMNFEKVGGSVENLVGDDPSLWYLDAGETETQKNFNSGSISTMISYLFRANYTYGSRYLITGSVRSDGSSKFSKDNRWGYFPSVALGWNLGNEDFFPKNAVLQKVKLRASWGIIGNEKISENDRFSLITNAQNAVFGTDEDLYAGSTLGNTANPNLRWESTTQTDIGLELGFWNNKLTVEFDVFDRKTKDILVEVTSPGYYGNGSFVKIRTNAADVRNQGFEFNFDLRHQIGFFKASFNANGAFIHNEVLQLAATTGDDSFISGGSLGNGDIVTRTEVGMPIGSFYGYNVIGIIQNQEDLENSAIIPNQNIGDLKFEDLNVDGIIDDQDRTYIGSPIPNFIYGFSTNLNYKQFTLSINLQGQVGNDLYNGKNAVRPDLYNFESRVANRWSGEGSSDTEPRATASGVNYSVSNYFIESGTYLRLRNVSFEYSFSKKRLKKINLTNLSLYLRGTNIYTFTKFSGYTPDIGSSDVISSGIDLGAYPVTAVGSVGISCTF